MSERRLTWTGDLVASNRQRLQQQVVDAIADGHMQLVLDLAACGYIDSAGLGVLVSCAKRAKDAGGAFVLEGITEELWALFHLTKIDQVLTVRSTRP